MTTAITEFRGENRWLSNFWPAPIDVAGLKCATVEHAYQALKSNDLEERAWIAGQRTPGLAKTRARKVKHPRLDWNEHRLRAMWLLLRMKFAIPELREKLLATGDAELVEGNSWGDCFWGQCPVGVGLNHLGRLLMLVRKEIREGLDGEALFKAYEEAAG